MMNNVTRQVVSIVKKNKVITCGDKIIPAIKNKVNINSALVLGENEQNVGDMLSEYIVRSTAKIFNIDIEKQLKMTKHLYAVGSILGGNQDATVWGSGFQTDITKRKYFHLKSRFYRWHHKLDVRAVRGPITRKILLEQGFFCPEVYGDPAILMPKFYQPQVMEHREYVIIPHHSKYYLFKENGNVLNLITNDWKKFIDILCSSDLVISSSLHGIILAEAYGKTAIMLSEIPNNDITKYKDWYYSTGREKFTIANSVEEAKLFFAKKDICRLSMEVLNRMQSDLLETFPIDLWEE